MNLEIVKGNEGYCLNLVDKNGCGYRILGNKPWGNPYNVPTYSFELDKEKMIEIRDKFDYYLKKM